MSSQILTDGKAPSCCRCNNEFPVQNNQRLGWTMGKMRPLWKAPKAIRDRFRREDNCAFLCGNCYFDLTDK